MKCQCGKLLTIPKKKKCPSETMKSKASNQNSIFYSSSSPIEFVFDVSLLFIAFLKCYPGLKSRSQSVLNSAVS